MEKQIPFTGILSNKSQENPDFFNWNRVKVRYCDGASSSGDSENKAEQLQFREQRIWSAAMEELMSQGMRYAKRGVLRTLPRTCTDHLDPTSCFFPENLIANVRTPLFVLNAAYDSWQVQASLAPPSADSQGYWRDCKMNNARCTGSQIKFLQGFWSHMLNMIKQFFMARKNGFFMYSCFAHCQSERQDTWFSGNAPLIRNKAERRDTWFSDNAPLIGNKGIACVMTQRMNPGIKQER